MVFFSILMRLDEIFKRLTSVLAVSQFRYLLRILTAIGLLIINGLKLDEKVRKYNVTRLKNARSAYFGTLVTLFDNLGQNQLAKEDVDCLWKYGLEPFFEKIIPDSMITFICSWSKNPGIYSLYLKPFVEKTGETTTPLFMMLNYLKIGQFHMKKPILSSVSRILTLADEPSLLENLPELKLEVRDGATLGIEVLLKNLSLLVNFLVENIPTDPKEAKGLPVEYLEILCQLSPYIEDIDAGKHFALTLLTYVLKGKIANERKLLSIMHTIGRLSNCLDDPKSFLK